MVVRARVEASNSSMATQRMEYSIWKHGLDVHDIDDGEFPIGERVTIIVGLSLAVETAKLILRDDPMIAFIDLVPKRPSIFCRKVRVRPKRVLGSSRQTLDPGEGLDEH